MVEAFLAQSETQALTELPPLIAEAEEQPETEALIDLPPLTDEEQPVAA